MHDELAPFLSPTAIIDADHPEVRAFAVAHRGDDPAPVTQAVALYYAVRDGIRYDPYAFELTAAGLQASRTLAAGRSWCVPKAVLLAALCRASGIPAKVGFADVRNHLSTERLRQAMQTDIFAWHGFAVLWLDGQWLKATPAFNVELCEKFHMRPLEFDGRSDSIYHPFDLEGRRHMEYIRFRGEYADVPVDAMMATFRELYAGFPAGGASPAAAGEFEADVAREVGSS